MIFKRWVENLNYYLSQADGRHKSPERHYPSFNLFLSWRVKFPTLCSTLVLINSPKNLLVKFIKKKIIIYLKKPKLPYIY